MGNKVVGISRAAETQKYMLLRIAWAIRLLFYSALEMTTIPSALFLCSARSTSAGDDLFKGVYTPADFYEFALKYNEMDEETMCQRIIEKKRPSKKWGKMKKRDSLLSALFPAHHRRLAV